MPTKKSMIIGVAVLAFIAAAFVVIRMATGSARETDFFRDRATAVAKLETKEDEERAIKKFEEEIAKTGDAKQAAAGLLNLGALYERRGDLPKAKEYYRTFIDKFPASPDIAAAQEAVDAINIRLLSFPGPTSDATFYAVKKGDTLTKISKMYTTTVELIMKANGLPDARIAVGRKLKVRTVPFKIVVVKSQNILILKAAEEIVKTYRISTGKDDSTPEGTFKIINKAVNPVWYTTGAIVPPDSPKNILGTRWMGISKEHYGIHGTTEPEAIGKSVTAGCVRMRNADVEELYDIVPVGTEVMIIA